MALTKISRSLLDTGISDSSDATAITITSDEKIGIGTSSPAAKVELNGDGELLRLDGTGGAARSMRFRGLSTSTPAFITIDGSFKLHCEDSGTHMEFHTADAERMRINSSGNVGIGTTSPSVPLDILTNLSSDTTSSPDTVLTIATKYASTGTNGAAGAGPRLEFKIPDDETNPITGVAIAGIKEAADDSDASAGMAFYVSQNDTTLDEAMRINHDGKILVGKTAADITSSAGFELTDAGLNMYSTQTSGGVSSTYHVLYGSSTKFYVDYAGVVYASNTSITSLSDERLKENVKDLDTGLSDILELKPKRFDWKEGEGTGEKNVSGFIAQDVEDTNFSDLVGNFKHNSLDDCKSFQYSGLIPALVKSIQELSAKVEELESKINE